jgi:hypothetical protein
MKEFCVSNRCRRAAILSYFGEAQPVQCSGCDICYSTAADAAGAETHDFTADFRVVLDLVMSNRKKLSVNQIIAVLRGAKEGQKHCSGAGFGSGSSRSLKWWDYVCSTMISLQLLKMEVVTYTAQGRSTSYTVLCSTPAAAAFIRDSQSSPGPLPAALIPLPLSLRAKVNPSGSLPAASTATEQFLDSISLADQELFAALTSKYAATSYIFQRFSKFSSFCDLFFTNTSTAGDLKSRRLRIVQSLQLRLTACCVGLLFINRLCCIKYSPRRRFLCSCSSSLALQLASCRLLGNSEQKLQKYGQLWCDIVVQFCGGNSFNPPARPLPQSMERTLSASICSEFDLALDKKVKGFSTCFSNRSSALEERI